MFEKLIEMIGAVSVDLPGKIERNFVGGGLSLILIFLYFEIRDLRLQVMNLSERVDMISTHHERYHK